MRCLTPPRPAATECLYPLLRCSSPAPAGFTLQPMSTSFSSDTSGNPDVSGNTDGWATRSRSLRRRLMQGSTVSLAGSFNYIAQYDISSLTQAALPQQRSYAVTLTPPTTAIRTTTQTLGINSGHSFGANPMMFLKRLGVNGALSPSSADGHIIVQSAADSLWPAASARWRRPAAERVSGVADAAVSSPPVRAQARVSLAALAA